MLVAEAAHGDHARARRAIGLRMLALELPHDRIDLGLCLRVRRARREPGHGRGATGRAAIRQGGGGIDPPRRPQIALEVEHRKLELARHDADDYPPLAVQLHMTADDGSVTAEAPLPQAVGDDDRVARGGLDVRRVERPSEQRRNAEQPERIAGYAVALHPFGPVSAGKIGAPAGVHGDVGERLRSAREVQHVGDRHVEPVLLPLEVPREHEGHARRIVVRQRLQQEHVHETENRRVGADPERQGQDRRERKAWRAPQKAESVSKILTQRSHRAVSCSFVCCRGRSVGARAQPSGVVVRNRGEREPAVRRARQGTRVPGLLEIAGDGFERDARQQQPHQELGQPWRTRHGSSLPGCSPRAIRASASRERASRAAPAGSRR